MDLSLQKRLASEILKVGKDRVWLNPKKLSEIAKAITKEDIKNLIKEGLIKVKNIKGRSRVWAILKHKQKKKGRRRGPGSRKGLKSARIDKKRQWINGIRAVRKLLKILKEKGEIDKKTYRRLYILSKSGLIRNRRQLLLWVQRIKG